MITVNKIGGKANTLYSTIYLNSSDSKPTDVANGSELIEIDTGKHYLFDAENQIWYEYSGGGGGQPTKITSLWSDVSGIAYGTITLSKAYTDYDVFVFKYKHNVSGDGWSEREYLSRDVAVGDILTIDQYDDRYITIVVNSTTSFNITASEKLTIFEITGIKFGSGGGGGGASTAENVSIDAIEGISADNVQGALEEIYSKQVQSEIILFSNGRFFNTEIAEILYDFDGGNTKIENGKIVISDLHYGLIVLNKVNDFNCKFLIQMEIDDIDKYSFVLQSGVATGTATFPSLIEGGVGRISYFSDTLDSLSIYKLSNQSGSGTGVFIGTTNESGHTPTLRIIKIAKLQKEISH